MVIVSDKAAIDGMLAFALEERLWVELASGALVPAMIATAEMLPKDAVVGLVVCGGNISLQDMSQWANLAQQA